MKLNREFLGGALMVVFCAGWFVFLVLGVLNEVGVVDISWMPNSEESSGDVDPGGYNQGPVRPGPPAGGGARGR